jgi:8-oxo-dGTP diphosphatase
LEIEINMHPPRVGIGVLIFNAKQEILLGKRLNSHGAHTWSPPGGHLEFGESFEACAIRETEEETNLHLENPRLIGVTNDIFQAENKHYVSIFLKATFPKDQIIQNNEPDKMTHWEWFGLDNLPATLFLPLANFIATTARDLLLK